MSASYVIPDLNISDPNYRLSIPLVSFAFTVICVFVLTALVEGVRRLGRNYDRKISARAAAAHYASSANLALSSDAKLALTEPDSATV